MGKQRRNILDDLPTSARTREIILDNTHFLPDSKRVRKTLNAIYDQATRSFRKGRVDPNEIVVDTSKRMEISASNDPETYALILMVIGTMSAFLLSRLTREKERLFIYFYQLQEDEQQVPSLKFTHERRSRINQPIRRQKFDRESRSEIMSFCRGENFLSRKEEQKPENPMFPTFHEVIVTVSTRNFKYLGANTHLIYRAEMMYDFMQSEFDNSGTVVDFAAVKTERNLILSRNPYEYAICWYVWHTTAALQKKISGEMKPVVEAIVKSV